MNKKEKLIYKVLNDGSEGLKKTKKNHEEMIKDYQTNGFGDMHPNNIGSYKTGLSYTHGYCIGHLELLKEINSLLSMSVNEIKELISENEKISIENDKYMNSLLDEIKKKYKSKK